jgi:peptidoglycan hydrolase CwlO-like protein
MSKRPYIIDVDEYVCSNLEDIRTMIKTLDFSSLEARIEDIQYHANKMESSLWAKNAEINKLKDKIEKLENPKGKKTKTKRKLKLSRINYD